MGGVLHERTACALRIIATRPTGYFHRKSAVGGACSHLETKSGNKLNIRNWSFKGRAGGGSRSDECKTSYDTIDRPKKQQKP